jgi:signal transduction histidine kinase
MSTQIGPAHTEAMWPQIDNLKRFAERWLRTRYALPVIFLLAAALLWVSEKTHRDTTTTLRSGIELTDARIKSLRLVQLLTETEAAESAYLVNAQMVHLAQYAAVKSELKAALSEVVAFFAAQGPGGEAAAMRVADFTRLKLDHIDRTLELARSGNLTGAIQMAQDERSRATSEALRLELNAQLSAAARLQERARTSIYDALDLNRAAVGVLTLSTLLSLIWLVRQLNRQDRERAHQQAALLQARQRLEAEVRKRTARLTELAQHLQSVREDERAHLARELHDELGALLTACKLEIARARIKRTEPSAMQLGFERINSHLNEGIALKRRIIEDLRPSALSNLGLSPALENLCREMSQSLGLPVRLLAADFSLAPEADLAVYRFVQEALTNVGKYARASAVTVTLKVVGDDATVEVTDDGVGFEPQDTYLGQHGLSGMQFRAESLGGSMQVRSRPGHGCTVRIEFAQLADEAGANTNTSTNTSKNTSVAH